MSINIIYIEIGIPNQAHECLGSGEVVSQHRTTFKHDVTQILKLRETQIWTSPVPVCFCIGRVTSILVFMSPVSLVLRTIVKWVDLKDRIGQRPPVYCMICLCFITQAYFLPALFDQKRTSKIKSLTLDVSTFFGS